VYDLENLVNEEAIVCVGLQRHVGGRKRESSKDKATFCILNRKRSLEMGGACSTYGEEERFIQGFGGET
jgi:hypothetical protein